MTPASSSSRLKLRMSGKALLVVPGDKIGGGDIRQGLPKGYGVSPGRLPVAVQQVPRQKDIVRPGLPDLAYQCFVVRPKLRSVEVRQLHDGASVKTGGEAGGGKCGPLRLQGVVAPPEEDRAQGAEDEELPQQMRTAAGTAWSRHDILPFSKV